MTPLRTQVKVRGWLTDPKPGKPRGGSSLTPAGPSGWVLVFDTETTTDLGQRLRLVTYQVRKDGKLREQGIATSKQLKPSEQETVRDYCHAHRLKLLDREGFINLFYTIAYDRRGTVIGFNLPFDISRLALRHAASKPRAQQKMMRGAFTYTLSRWKSRPPIRIKKISPRAAFIQFTAPEGRSPEARNKARGGKSQGVFRGHFVDVTTLAGALLGSKPTLAKLANTLGVAEGKINIDADLLGAPISVELLDYAIRDVQVTWDCYQRLNTQYSALDLPGTPLHKIYSEASIGKAHLAAIGVKGWREVQPDVPDWLIATVMETYYGGRTETHLRRHPMPGVLTDVTSEYPTVFVLQKLLPWLIGTGINWVKEDPVTTAAWLAGLTVERLLDPGTWPQLTKLVQLQPGPNDLLPTRADYTGDGTFNVAQAHRTDGGPHQWYTLADAAASVLATGHVPIIVRTLAFSSRPAQDGLQSIRLAGQRDVDPHVDDLIAALVELRQDLKASPDLADQAAAAAIKATVNSVSYGIPIEVNTTPEPDRPPVLVHLPDGGSFEARPPRSEQPGAYFHPLIATFVASAGRLLLALIIRMVTDAGGAYVFCDTDSLFIVATETGDLQPCPGGPHTTADGQEAVQALSWQQVANMVDRLASLNPFGGRLAGKSILKIEPDNYDPTTGEQRSVYAFAIASKRYALYTLDPEGRPVLVTDHDSQRRSEHGLGHLLPGNDPTPVAEPGEFYDQWWTHLLHLELGLEHPGPDWLDRPAIGRLAITSPTDDKAFARHNARKRYDEQIRPGNFAIVAYPTAGERARTGVSLLVAPYQKNPARWGSANWIDRDHPDRTYRIRTGDDTYILPGMITVKSYRDYFAEYAHHPEGKAAGPDGQPCRADTFGLLRPLTIDPGPRLGRIGKETNRVDTDTDLANPDQAVLVYAEKRCRGCAETVSGRKQWCSETCRKRILRRMSHESN